MKYLLSTLLLLLPFVCTRAYDIKVDDVHYNLDAELHVATVCGCGSRVSGISIPASIEAYGQTYAVTAIADSAFMKNGYLQGVDISSSVTRIGKSAFRDCTRLSTIPIPASVTFIGEFAFRGCTAIADFVVDELNPTYRAHEGALYNKRMTLLINCPVGKWGEFHVPETVEQIAPYACYKCSHFGMVVIPNAVKRIGEHAFDNCSSLTDIHLGTGIEYIGDNAFDNNKNLKDVYCQAAQPPTAFDHTFDYTWVEYCKLHVLSGSISRYQKAKPWNWFDSIVALSQREIEVAIQSPTATPDSPSSYFTLNGQPASSYHRGILIQRRSDGHARKVIKK